ncbi:hypothetical protein [Streptosporangium sp. NPDC051022]|uniref:hypothetical protein n=1 Tax=Streptosporangium sp. NPDC051022 TaxID=3155752 RepID=UPI0034230C86
MREPRWGTPRPTAAAVVGLVLVVVLAALTPSSWSGVWRPADSGTSLWVPQADGAHQATAPRLLTGGAEHLPTAGQLRSMPAVGTAGAASTSPADIWLSTGPASIPRRDVQRIVTSRSPPRS